MQRPIRQFSGKMALDMRLKEVEPEERLEFVKRSSNLLQIFKRAPNDGLFPPIKPVEEMTHLDLPLLIKEKRFDTLADLIKLKLTQEDPQLTNALIS